MQPHADFPLNCFRFWDIPSPWWQASTILVGVASGLSLLVGVTAAAACCVTYVVHTGTARAAGFIQLCAGREQSDHSLPKENKRRKISSLGDFFSPMAKAGINRRKGKLKRRILPNYTHHKFQGLENLFINTGENYWSGNWSVPHSSHSLHDSAFPRCFQKDPLGPHITPGFSRLVIKLINVGSCRWHFFFLPHSLARLK